VSLGQIFLQEVKMHPQKICEDFASMGAALVLEGNELFIDNPENVYPALQDFAKSYKSRIIKYLKGEYSKEDHNIIQTIDKIIHYYNGVDQEINSKIESWLREDLESIQMINDLLVIYWNNGWNDFTDPVANFENDETAKLSKQIFKKAMLFMRKN
jgi:hypothetical protein